VDAQLLQLNNGTPNTQPVTVTFGALLDRYIAEEIPTRKSTRGSYLSIIRKHLRPRWERLFIPEIKPAMIHTWLQSLTIEPISKGHVRSLMSRLFDLAALWEYLPPERCNPLELVKVKNVTKRTKETVVITQEQFRDVIWRLPPHVNVVAVLAGCLGLRVSEALGLKWSDLDGMKQAVRIQRSAHLAPEFSSCRLEIFFVVLFGHSGGVGNG
jgi:integrase